MTGLPDDVIYATQAWATNAALIADVHRLGYLKDEDHVLDPTWGRGTWWRVWRPAWLLGPRDNWDFRDMRFPADRFDAVAYDPPYKLNGTPSGPDARYGVDDPMPWQERHLLMAQGLAECVRVTKPGGIILMKCQDQVCSGKVRWQTRIFADEGERLGCELIDRFDILGTRAQPSGRRQVHARRNSSTLLVFKKGRR
jgi:DNA modification methylase